MTAEQLQFVKDAATDAATAKHVFPEMAACEAALESSYGQSALAREDFNFFGTKQHQHPIYETANLPTREFEGGEWKIIEARFVKYPDRISSFRDRMQTLLRLAPYYPHYMSAINAATPETYISEVSATWATDPNRAKTVLEIYREVYA